MMGSLMYFEAIERRKLLGLLTAKCGIADRYGCVCTHKGGGVTLSQPGFSDDEAVGRTNSCQNTKYELFFAAP